MLADRFRVLELLGTGGMGEVYLAEDARLNRQVAIKLLSDELARDSESLARFEREARTAARLNHPNVATVYDFWQSEGVSFIAMELLEGKTLRDTLLEQKSLPVVELLDIAIQIARGLAAAHQGNIVHRDLKPANVMILEDGRVKILDFGLAKAVQSETSEMDYETRASLTGVGQVLGTVNYMSPEQVRGEPLDARSDLFSLGTVLCEMACGSVPFRRATAADTMSAILNDSPRSARGLETEIPAQLAPLIERLLAKEPRDRFQSSRDVLADLERLKKDAESAQRAASSKGPKSIAVLPFVNRSADPENEYFSDGLAEELINALTHLEGLHVASRTSAFRYKGQDADIRTIGRELDVDTVLEGSVRKSGKRLRITAQLIGAADGYHIWSERYDRDLEDIFEVQDEITATIVESLKIQVGAGSPAGAIKRTTDNVDAYNEYLKGRYFSYKRRRRPATPGECARPKSADPSSIAPRIGDRH